MSLLARLAILIVVTVLPLAVMQFLTSKDLRNAMIQQVADRAMLTAMSVAGEQARLGEGMYQLLASLHIRSVSGLGEVCANVVPNLAQHLPTFKILYLADSDGTILCATRVDWVGKHLGAMPRVGDEPPTVARWLEGTGAFTMEIALGSSETAPAVVGVALEPSWIEQVLVTSHSPPGTRVALIDPTGRVLVRTGVNRAEEGRAPEHFMPIVTAGRAFAGRMIGLTGRHELDAFLPLSAQLPGTMVNVGLDEEVALADVNSASRRTVVIDAIVLAVVLAIALIGGQRLVRTPITELIDAMRRRQKGECSPQVPVRNFFATIPELRQLAEAYNAAAKEMAAWEKGRLAVAAEAQAAAADLSRILESTTDAILEIDRQWVYSFRNARASELLERSGQSLVGMTIWEAFPLLVGSPDERYLRRAMGGTAADYETFYAPWNQWFHVRAFPTTQGLALFFRDITEEKELEEAARRSSGLLSQVLELLPVGVWILDENGRLVRTNPASRRIWGDEHLIAPDRAGRYRAKQTATDELIRLDEWAGAPAVARGETVLAEKIEIERLDGSAKTVLASVVPIHDVAGRIIGAIAVHEDITPLSEAEKALLQAKNEAERANLAKSKFLATASHDLRQPVQAMFFMVDVLAACSQGPRATKAVSTMRASVEALRILLDGLLDISKLDAGGIEPVIIASPISPLLAPLASEYRPRLHAKGLLMRVVDSSVWLRTDPQLLGRILRNLLDNALKYTPQGTVLVGCRRHGDHVSIEVVDTGIGIPSSQLNLIWEEFFQADNPSRDRRKGLGLGLAIVRGLARLLGHTVSVQSREGHGSIFSVDVPLAPQQEFHAAPLHLFDAKRTEGVVAVVDDEAMVLDSLCTVLGLAGYKDVICASDTAGLVDSLSKAHVIPDVIVADYRLKQGHTGIEAVKAVRAFVHRAVPAIIVSGDTTPELLEATRANRLRLMNKPIQAQELVAAIATAVSEGAAAQDVPARIGTNTL